MSEWQPIETAPRDGSFALGSSYEEWKYPFIMNFSDAQWVNTCGYDEVSPTHWMPLPEPPK